MALCALALAAGCSAERLSLQQAVDTALRDSPLLAAGRLDADAARQAAKGARALRNPDIEYLAERCGGCRVGLGHPGHPAARDSMGLAGSARG